MLELADIVRATGDEYRETNGSRMLPSHHRALRDIERCRTATLGGHVQRCDCCGLERYSYHSCRNRHCPKCEGDATQRWLAALRERLLTTDYFFLTFTLPAALRPVAYANQRLVYGLFLQCAAQSVLKLTGDERHLGAKPGILAVLHTWTQLLTYHVHAHLLVTAGGLTAGGDAWRFPRQRKWLVPGFALADVFRGKMRSALQEHGLLAQVPSDAWTRHRWVVDCKHAGNGERIAEYLARYSRRVAITNSRLESYENGNVTFRYQDRQTKRQRLCTLSDQEFVRRFLMHILPRGFAKIRYYGLFSSRSGDGRQQARDLLDTARNAMALVPSTAIPQTSDTDSGDDPNVSTGKRDAPCPRCKRGRMRCVAALPRPRGPP